MNKNKFLKIACLVLPILFLSFFYITYGANPGVIPASTNCSENASCAKLDSDGSNINFGCTNCNVSIDCNPDIGLTGYAFGENIGWINLAPTNGGVTMTANNSGILTGYAWGENAGWINFAPTNGGVTISKTDPTKGEFNGWAWSENYGWIKFECPGSACVASNWTACGGGWHQKQCSNGYDDGDPEDLLSDINDPGCWDNPNYDSNGYLTGTYNPLDDNEEDPADLCLNITGEQLEIPVGYISDSSHIPSAWCVPSFGVSIINPVSVDGNAGSFYSSDCDIDHNGFIDIDCGGKNINCDVNNNGLIDNTTACVETVDTSLGVEDTIFPYFSIADFETNKLRAKVTGVTADSKVEFFVKDESTGINTSIGEGTLVSGTTDTYEIAWNKTNTTISCQTNSNGVSFEITALATKDTSPTSETDTSEAVVVIVGKACGSHATQCTDGIDNDNDNTCDFLGCTINEVVYPADPDCVDVNDDNETGDFCTLHPDDLAGCFCPKPENQNDPLCVNPPTYCELHPEDTAQCFCSLPENSSNPACILPVLNCFTDPSLCTCADDPTLPGCQSNGNPCDEDPNGPGCVKVEPYVSGIITPEVIDKINFGLKVAATTSVAVAGVISLATAIFLNPLSVPELVLIPTRLWSLLFTALGIKKRRKPWGTVYDSITKQPLDPVYVSLRDLEGVEIASSITDLDGRYGFLVKPGVYKVVPRKTNYIFPSDKLSKHFRDEFYQNLYFGDYINIKDSGEVIIKNIPMDPVNFDWNEFEKNKKKMFKFYSKKDLLIAKVSNWFFGFGFAIAGVAFLVSQEKYNIVVFGLYILMFILRKVSFRLKAKGRLFNKDGSPFSFASIRVYTVETNIEMAHQAADEMGRYHILLPNGTYYVKVEKKNNDGSYSVVYTSDYFKVVHGVLNRVFNI